MRRTLVAAAALYLMALPAVAAADPPDRRQETLTGHAVVTDVCAFPVTIDWSADATITDFYNTDGDLIRTHVAASETDVYSANGKSLTSDTYYYSQEVIFDAEGNVTHVYANGVVAKTRLPDGSLFVSAGRLDFIGRPGATFALTPDVGTSGNITGFCAALAP
jgi:hypothetical protein